MRVFVPSPLRSYTSGAGEVSVDLEAPPGAPPGAKATLADVLARLDARFPGLRFRVVDEQGRIRPHVRLFVGTRLARDLSHAVGAEDDVHLVAALSGG